MSDNAALGTYRGIVVNNVDPSAGARVTLKIPQILGNAESNWAVPAIPTPVIPNVGDVLWVSFDGGDLANPVYTPQGLRELSEAIDGLDGSTFTGSPPKAPSALALSTARVISAEGITSCIVVAEWTAPTENQDGSVPIKRLTGYRVQYSTDGTTWSGGASTSDTSWLFNGIAPSSDVTVRVQSLSATSGPGLWTSTTIATDDPAGPDVPSKPVAMGTVNGITVAWDGKNDGGAAMPAQFSLAEIQRSTSAAFTTSTVLSTLTGAGTYFDKSAGTGTQYYYRLVGISTAGVRSAASAISDAATGLVDPAITDLDGRITQTATDLTNYQQQVSGPGGLLDGKSTVYYQSTDPNAGATFTEDNEGDLWVDSSTGKVKVFTWGTGPGTWEDVTNQQAIDAATAAADAQSTADSKITTFYAVSTATPTAGAVGDLWVVTDLNGKIKRWDGATWVTLDVASQSYVQSRGTDLITNGTGALGNNTNFSAFDYVGTDAPTGANCSFRVKASTPQGPSIDELIPFDPSKKYRFSFQIRETVSGQTNTGYGFIAPYDGAGSLITPSMYMYATGTTTTLAQPLNPGDTVVYLTSAANWWGSAAKPAGVNTHRRSIIFWDYVDSFGKVWPVGSYSRNGYITDRWADGGVDTTANTITLRAPYSGPAKPAGTSLSNATSGGSFIYMPSFASTAVTEVWTTYADTFSAGIMASNLQAVTYDGSATWTTGVPPGTAMVKVGWLLNYPSGGTGKHAIAAVSFSDAKAAQAAADAAASNLTAYQQQVSGPGGLLDGKSSIYFQTSDPNAGSTFTANNEGDLWVNASTGKVKVFTWGTGPGSWGDVTNQQAIDAATAAANAQTTANAKITTYYQSTQPTAGNNGDLWYNTTTGATYFLSGGSWVLAPLGAGALGSSVNNSLGQKLYDGGEDASAWTNTRAGGSAPTSTSVTDADTGGFVLRCVGGSDLVRSGPNGRLIPFDPNVLYRITGRVRQVTNPTVAGNSKVYIGLTGYAADGVTLVNSTGANSNGAQHYVACNGTVITAGTGWQTFTGYIKGRAATGSSGVKSSPTSPGVMQTNVKYIRPLCYVNSAGGDGTADIDLITVEVVETGAVGGANLQADAIDGKTITGATFRTAATGGRTEISSSKGALTGSYLNFYTGSPNEKAPGYVQCIYDPSTLEMYLWLSASTDVSSDSTGTIAINPRTAFNGYTSYISIPMDTGDVGPIRYTASEVGMYNTNLRVGDSGNTAQRVLYQNKADDSGNAMESRTYLSAGTDSAYTVALYKSGAQTNVLRVFNSGVATINGREAVTKASNGKTHWGKFTGTTDASGYLTITHGCGFTPSVLYPNHATTTNTSTAIAAKIGYDTVTATTVRLRCYGFNGAALASTSVTIDVIFGQ